MGNGVCQELYAAPTREEMAELKQAQQLFKSNLFKLQVRKKYYWHTPSLLDYA